MTHSNNDRDRRRRQKQARRREQRLRREQAREQRREQRRQARQASQHQQPPPAPAFNGPPPSGRCASAERLSCFEAASRFVCFLAACPNQLYIGRGDVALLDEAADRVTEQGGDFLAAVVRAELPGRPPGLGFLMVSTANPCRSPHDCPNDHKLPPGAMATFGHAAGTSPEPIRASERWARAITTVLGRDTTP
jgi:type II secretory pathway pseudopilin PulG